MGKRILVTGGAGFIGSHLCHHLIEHGADVICLDNYFTGNKENVYHLLDRSNFELIRHDVVDPIRLEVDQIYNLACPASPVHYQQDPIRTVRTSVIGTANMLELASTAGATILQASTSEVYGDPKVHPQPEEYWGNVNPIGVRSCYDEGKRVSETLCFDYHRQKNTKIKVLRIFNTYGPRMAIDDGRVVSNFIVQALRGKNLTLYGDGSQTRSFCYISDLIRGMVCMMNDTPDSQTGPINLGSPVEHTMLELAETVLELTNTKSKIEYYPLPSDDPNRRCPDITKAKKILNWSPRVTLTEGLRESINYFQQKLSSIETEK